MTINSMDANSIAVSTADFFRTRVAHHRGSVTTQQYEAVRDLVQSMLADQLDNKDIQHKTIDPITGEVTDHVSS